MSCKYAPRGYATFSTADLDEAKQSIKDGAGLIFGWHFGNAAASIRYVKVYDATVSGTTVGTTVPKLRIQLPASGGATVYFEAGIRFDTGMTIACVTGAADNSTGAPAANDVTASVFFV